MNTRKNSFSHSFSTSTSRFMKKGRLTRAGGYLDLFLWSITSKLVHMQRSTSCCIWWCQKDRIITIQQLTLVLGRRAKRGRSLSNLSATSNCEPHDFIRLRASATVGLESREADGCPSFLEKRDRRELSFLIESRSQCTQTAPSRTSRACSMPKQKTQQSCVSLGVK